MRCQWPVLFALLVSCFVGPRPAESQDVGNVAVSAASTGMRRYEPGLWGAVAVTGWNWQETDAEALVSVYFGTESHLQYTRRLWIPAGSTRVTWLPIRIAADGQSMDDQIQMTSLVLDPTSDREVLQRKEDSLLTKTVPLIVDSESVKTGTIFPAPSFFEESQRRISISMTT